MESVIVFDIWGDYAHFKRIETTTSPLTYSVPTGTVLSGLIAGIVGHKRDTYYEYFSRNNIEYSIKLINPINKTRINQNLINTAQKPYYNLYNKDNPRTQIPYEYLIDPKYRIYVGIKNKDRFSKLIKNLKEHKSAYTPFLGLSEHIANFKFIGEFEAEQKQDKKTKIHSVLPKKRVEINLNNIKEGMRWTVEKIPLYMNNQRIVQEYTEIILDTNGRPILTENSKYYEVNEENIMFL
ncbi:MAG: type I-B CRISPR-associated protein Cas5b [Promethearchaeia archaeon]